VADLAGVCRVMRVVALRAADELLVDRVHDATLDLDHDGLVVLVAHHHPLQNALRHRPLLYARTPAARSTVFTRAMSRRTCCTRAVLSSCPVARWKRRLNCSFFRFSSCSVSSSLVLPTRSRAFISGTSQQHG